MTQTQTERPGLLRVEDAFEGVLFVGKRLTVGDRAYLIFNDQAGMPGIRSGDAFTPDYGKTIEYRDAAAPAVAIDMVLHCPNCGLQHVDAADEPSRAVGPYTVDAGGIRLVLPIAAAVTPPWTNPPHRSHLCHGCGHIWRPADVPTNGVRCVATQGRNDSPLKGGAR